MLYFRFPLSQGGEGETKRQPSSSRASAHEVRIRPKTLGTARSPIRPLQMLENPLSAKAWYSHVYGWLIASYKALVLRFI